MSQPSATLARPLRSDAARNRRSLIRAAREIFERDGFVSARITDIAERAGVAHGSFYSHFPDKRAALTAVLDEVQEEMLQPGSDSDARINLTRPRSSNTRTAPTSRPISATPG